MGENGELLFKPQPIETDKLAQSVELAEGRNPVPGSHRVEGDDWPPKLPSDCHMCQGVHTHKQNECSS